MQQQGAAQVCGLTLCSADSSDHELEYTGELKSSSIFTYFELPVRSVVKGGGQRGRLHTSRILQATSHPDLRARELYRMLNTRFALLLIALLQ